MDGKLYVVLSAENIHPGKGTPVTQLNMRRISDGVKVSERYRTTEQVERAFVDDRNHTFLYSDGDGYHFMNPETYDQLVATEEVIGDAAPYLQEGMTVILSTHNDVPIAIDLPRTNGSGVRKAGDQGGGIGRLDGRDRSGSVSHSRRSSTPARPCQAPRAGRRDSPARRRITAG
jgi:translation elongation factor P/translation initiation factor 5A